MLTKYFEMVLSLQTVQLDPFADGRSEIVA